MNYLKWAIITAASIFFSACGNVYEEITINEDGSGSYLMQTDIIPFSQNMAFAMSKMFMQKDGSKTLNEDSLRQAIGEEIWADFGDADIDSTLNILEDLPDSLKNNEEFMAFARQLHMFMRGGKNQGQINMGLEFAFADGKKLQEIFSGIEKFQASQNSQATGMPLDEISAVKSTVKVNLDKTKFVRNTTYRNVVENQQDLDQARELIGNGKLVTIVHTKRKIKTVKGDYLISQEDYKATFEYDFLLAMSGNLNTDFEIIFE